MNIFDFFSNNESTSPTSQQNVFASLEQKIDLLVQTLDVKVPDNPGLPTSVQKLLDQERKIEAIKLYRDLHGVGLREAKDAIEANIEPPLTRIERKLDAVLVELGIVLPTSNAVDTIGGNGTNLSEYQLTRLRHLVTEGKMIEAVLVYRTYTGASLPAAKTWVDRFENSLRNR